jgi:hypothetical protein
VELELLIKALLAETQQQKERVAVVALVRQVLMLPQVRVLVAQV